MTEHARLYPTSVEEYLQGELVSEVRHEYVAGQVFAMVGGTRGHNLVALNIAAFLHAHLKGGPCFAYMSDMKVRIEAADAFYYPDVVVSCESLAMSDVFLREPVLIFEVLSPSTETTDRREKCLNYQKLPSLQEYVLVSPEEVRVEVYRRRGEALELDIYGEEDTAIGLRSVKANLPLAEVYADVFN